VNFVGMEPGEKIAAITPVPGFEPSHFVVTLTKGGQIKKTALDEYENYREKGIIGVKIEDGDQLFSPRSPTANASSSSRPRRACRSASPRSRSARRAARRWA
jgi:DNA gyrase/topoisomerase IV subunit A